MSLFVLESEEIEDFLNKHKACGSLLDLSVDELRKSDIIPLELVLFKYLVQRALNKD